MGKGEIATEEQFLLLSTLFCYLMLDFFVKRRTRFSLRDKRLFEIIEVEITRVDCNYKLYQKKKKKKKRNKKSFKITVAYITSDVVI